MGDINFLSNQKGGNKNKGRQKREKEAIKWTDPLKEREPVNIKSKPEKRGNFSDFFDLFKGGKKSVKTKERTGKGLLSEKDVESKRKEVLEFIKKSEEPIFKKEEKKQAPDFQKIILEKKNNIPKISFRKKLSDRWRAYLEQRKKAREEKERIKKEKREKEKAEKKVSPIFKPAEKEIISEKKEIKNIFASISPKPAPAAHKKEEHKKKKAGETIKEKIESITPSILGTNLIEGEISTYFNWRKNAIIFISGIIFSCLLVGLSYIGVVYWENREKTNIKSSKLDEINKEIGQLEGLADKIQKLKDKSRLVEELLNKHIYWTNFFKFLEENTLKEIYYTSGFSGGTEGAYSLSAKAPNFQAIYDQINVLKKNKDVLGAGAEGGSLSAPEDKTEAEKIKENEENKTTEETDLPQSEVGFQLDLKINPNIFLK